MWRCVFTGLLFAGLLCGQGNYGRRTRGSGSGSTPGLYDVPAVTFEGKVKVANTKEVRIDTDSEAQSLTFRVTHKTKFLKDGKPIKPADIPLETIVSVDATREPDLKFTALTVVVSPPKPKPADQ